MNFVVRKEDILNNDYILKKFKISKKDKLIYFSLFCILLIISLIASILGRAETFLLLFFFIVMMLIKISIRKKSDIYHTYRYLIGEFKVKVEDNIFYLVSYDSEIKVKLNQAKLISKQDSYILLDNNGFEIIIFKNKDTDYDEILNLIKTYGGTSI